MVKPAVRPLVSSEMKADGDLAGEERRICQNLGKGIFSVGRRLVKFNAPLDDDELSFHATTTSASSSLAFQSLISAKRILFREKLNPHVAERRATGSNNGRTAGPARGGVRLRET
jgi:hypothetical protein